MANVMIPKIIHQIWIGNETLPDNCKLFAKRMQQIHTNLGYIYYLWGNEVYDRYENDKILQHYRNKGFPNAYIADRIRLLLLRDFGGIYVDIDAECIKSFDTILHKLNSKIAFFAGIRKRVPTNNTALVDVTVMGSEPNAHIINKCLSTYTNINWANGGQMIGAKIIEELDETVVLFNYKYFYDTKITINTVILHDSHRLYSWKR
jgi:mannosyltransferase OCH1-like enzyme